MKGFHSPYFNESHKDFRLAIRKFLSENVLNNYKVMPFVDDWDESGKMPIKEIYLKMGKAGILAA